MWTKLYWGGKCTVKIILLFLRNKNKVLAGKKRIKICNLKKKTEKKEIKQENFKLMNQMVAEFCEYTKNYLTKYFKMVSLGYM